MTELIKASPPLLATAGIMNGWEDNLLELERPKSKEKRRPLSTQMLEGQTLVPLRGCIFKSTCLKSMEVIQKAYLLSWRCVHVCLCVCIYTQLFKKSYIKGFAELNSVNFNLSITCSHKCTHTHILPPDPKVLQHTCV